MCTPMSCAGSAPDQSLRQFASLFTGTVSHWSAAAQEGILFAVPWMSPMFSRVGDQWMPEAVCLIFSMPLDQHSWYQWGTLISGSGWQLWKLVLGSDSTLCCWLSFSTSLQLYASTLLLALAWSQGRILQRYRFTCVVPWFCCRSVEISSVNICFHFTMLMVVSYPTEAEGTENIRV